MERRSNGVSGNGGNGGDIGGRFGRDGMRFGWDLRLWCHVWNSLESGIFSKIELWRCKSVKGKIS